MLDYTISTKDHFQHYGSKQSKATEEKALLLTSSYLGKFNWGDRAHFTDFSIKDSRRISLNSKGFANGKCNGFRK